MVAPSPPGESLNTTAPAPIRAMLDGLDRLSRLDGWMGALCLLLLTLLMLSEIFLRTASNFIPNIPHSIPVAWEWSSYLMACAFTFGSAMTMRAGGHIRVKLLISRLSPGPLRGLEVLVSLIGLAFTAFLAYAMIKFTWNSFERGQTSISSGTPLWPAQTMVTIAIVLLTCQFLARTIQAILGLPLEDPRLKMSSAAE